MMLGISKQAKYELRVGWYIGEDVPVSVIFCGLSGELPMALSRALTKALSICLRRSSHGAVKEFEASCNTAPLRSLRDSVQ